MDSLAPSEFERGPAPAVSAIAERFIIFKSPCCPVQFFNFFLLLSPSLGVFPLVPNMTGGSLAPRPVTYLHALVHSPSSSHIIGSSAEPAGLTHRITNRSTSTKESHHIVNLDLFWQWWMIIFEFASNRSILVFLLSACTCSPERQAPLRPLVNALKANFGLHFGLHGHVYMYFLSNYYYLVYTILIYTNWWNHKIWDEKERPYGGECDLKKNIFEKLIPIHYLKGKNTFFLIAKMTRAKWWHAHPRTD